MITCTKNLNTWPRRKFISSLTATAVVATTIKPLISFATAKKASADDLTVQQVIEIILKSIPGAPFKNTVDTIKSGDANQKVTGIVTTMFATDDVIEKTAKLGSNFIIAHEPTFYNHTDDTGWLQNDDVYRYKKALLENNNIVVWRCHDYIHAHKPDGVLMGVLNALGWSKYYDASNPHIISIPSTSFAKIIDHAKKQLEIAHVKIIGDRDQMCSRIALIPGAAGGRLQIAALQKEKPDLLIVGELDEWETSEYIRDLRYMGANTSLLVLGHIASEEPGLQWLAEWLKPQLPGINITHVRSTDAFTWA
jgi:putative NIF3 family GTP cyclohydrolase 1 type 2